MEASASAAPTATAPAGPDAAIAFSVSERAFRRIGVIMAKEPPGTRLRVAVNGGGCSGFQYAFEMDAALNEDDTVLGAPGAEVVIDSISAGYMTNAVLDYVEDLMGAAFKITNPLATASCGCGTSFSL